VGLFILHFELLFLFWGMHIPSVTSSLSISVFLFVLTLIYKLCPLSSPQFATTVMLLGEPQSSEHSVVLQFGSEHKASVARLHFCGAGLISSKVTADVDRTSTCSFAPHAAACQALAMPSLCDEFGLHGVQVEPWDDSGTWRRVIQQRCERGDPQAMATLMQIVNPAQGGIMWRTSKESVSDELGIPRQLSKVECLDLSAVERHAYQRRHKETAASAQQLLPEDIVALVRASKAIPAHLDRPLYAKEAASLFPRLQHLRQVTIHARALAVGIAGLICT
jgi:RNase P protein component